MTPRTIDSEIVVFSDLESQRENLVEAKHRKLIRSHHRNGILDRDLKPNAKIRDELNVSSGADLLTGLPRRASAYASLCHRNWSNTRPQNL